jgi:CheY-like chemotaxis protein
LSVPTILLIDDDRDLVEVTKLALESAGYNVTTAYNSEDGKKQTLDSEPDLIILDVMMETDSAGFEVARWLRSEENTKNIPIIMLTAINQKFPMQFDKDEIWLPVDEFLEKPVNPDDLLEIVKSKVSAE